MKLSLSALLLLFMLTPLMAAEPPGVVIAHSPTATKQYIGSPSLAILPNGEYIASHDFFGPGTNFDTSVVFASADKGKTWTKRATLKNQWWSTLFVHKKELYILGTTKEYGQTVIRKSTDSGKTWTEPKDETNGLLIKDGMYHCAPVPVVAHARKLWRAMEEYKGPKWGAFEAFMMSVPDDADLLNAKNWAFSNRIGRSEKWLDGKVNAILEGNAILDPQGKIVNLLRVDHLDWSERAALMRVSDDGKTITFDPEKDFIAFPGGSKKFTIRFDATSKRYWTLANTIPKEHRDQPKRKPTQVRNTLSLMSSADLREWKIEKDLLSDTDALNVGFQYVDWLFDGEDILALVRTAFPEKDGTKARNAHDANWLTFHRFEQFRK